MADIELRHNGSVCLFEPLTVAGREWMEECIAAEPWQWFCGMLAVDTRYAGDVAEAMVEDGLEVAA